MGSSDPKSNPVASAFSGKIHRSVQKVNALRVRPEQIDDIVSRLVDAEKTIIQMQSELSRLDADLDESRRLNLRAAELLDITFEHLAGPTAAAKADPQPSQTQQKHQP